MEHELLAPFLFFFKFIPLYFLSAGYKEKKRVYLIILQTRIKLFSKQWFVSSNYTFHTVFFL